MASAVDTYNVILQTDYAEYVKYVHKGAWQKTRFHRFLCAYVQEFVERPTDKPYEILAIHTPPQHGKSQSVTETLPSWWLGKHPDGRVIEISYNENFAIRFGKRNKRKVDEFGEEIFGIKVSKDSAQAKQFDIEGHAGGMISRGIGTGVTGEACHLMIIDDPIKNKAEASSQSRRDLIYDEWLMSFKTRLARGAKVIIIMTRWHEDDLVGRLLQEEENIKYLRFPCEAEADGDLLGRKEGEPLCPELGKDAVWLKIFKETMLSREGSMAWNALYQGRPTALEGNIIERDWWQYYEALPDDCASWTMSVDASFKDEENSDYVAIQVWAKARHNLYLVDAVKKRLNFPNTILEIRRLKAMYPECKTVLIEDRANGSAIITMLRTEMSGVIAVQPNGSKMSRVQAVLGAIESGNVYLPKMKRWVEDFVDECSSFPNGQHDDQVDSMSQALNRLIYQRGERAKKREIPAFERMFPEFFKNRVEGHGKVKVI